MHSPESSFIASSGFVLQATDKENFGKHSVDKCCSQTTREHLYTVLKLILILNKFLSTKNNDKVNVLIVILSAIRNTF